jgi:hypothetical protein
VFATLSNGAMSGLNVDKMPHPIRDQRIADRNRRTTCEVRGYCGPFINESFYDSFPDPLWRGTGECVVCCNTCNVGMEKEKERLARMAETPGAISSVAVSLTPLPPPREPMQRANPA